MKIAPGQQAGVRVSVSEYTVSVWPEDHDCFEASLWCLVVRQRRHGQWSVQQGRVSEAGLVLGRDGNWTLDRPGDPAVRFTEQEALEAARKRAGSISNYDRHVTDVLKDHANRGCLG